MSTARAKFRCNSVTSFTYGQRKYFLTAVTDWRTEKNERFTKHTPPSSSLEITVDNPAVHFVPGDSYHFYFISASGEASND